MTFTFLTILVFALGFYYAKKYGNKAKKDIENHFKENVKPPESAAIHKKPTSNKRKTLPKNFNELLENSTIEELISVLKKCNIDAYGGYSKKTALAFDKCPHELAKWLIENGADINATDTYGSTPLHSRSIGIFGNITSLLELGADINLSDGKIGNALHTAAFSHNVNNCKILLDAGTSVDAMSESGLTALELSLSMCYNIDILKMVEISHIFLSAGAKKTTKMQASVKKIGKTFEFHREGFNKDTVGQYSQALDKLYKLFEVTPVQNRVMHDGKSIITVTNKSWQKQHQELWELLVPSSGPSETIQGEVIRISGKISDEIERNGGGNWSSNHNNMNNAFLEFVSTGKSLSSSELEELKLLIKDIKQYNEEVDSMCEFAVKWVLNNPVPQNLGSVDYDI
ncbi:ankyrin repeat domain-containing protein [Maribacter sp. Hel_I_7]|uniref:ankyrin repeat domain-containing protein n=1 Tax=Maribacter sp. Hel_I_7 TaxID=1249997 RepID=UPI00068F4542|nr:ankyrin repeat domain-containing protein [Maribacter sp. Hel_I_7]